MLTRICNAQNQMDAACEKLGRQLNIMEVCGTHTVAIFRNGIRSSIPKRLNLLSGPGCPVCVTDQAYIDKVLTLSENENCIIATYGDMIRVPGRKGSLEKNQTHDNVRVVLSSEDALKLAEENPSKTVVFIAVGFETTTPATAVAIKEAKEKNIKNFCILHNHKLVVPAMQALLTEKNHKIDAFLCPGHVSVIIGYGAFEPIVTEFKRPCVVCGFEPMQIIEGLAEVCRQLEVGEPKANTIYEAVVTREGNSRARKIVDECFEVADSYWRGLGKIPNSGLALKEGYREFDAEERFELDIDPEEDRTGCRCGEVLCGLITSEQCQLFGKACTPTDPVGPCMVSSEGACAAWYKYGRRKRRR